MRRKNKTAGDRIDPVPCLSVQAECLLCVCLIVFPVAQDYGREGREFEREESFGHNCPLFRFRCMVFLRGLDTAEEGFAFMGAGVPREEPEICPTACIVHSDDTAQVIIERA